MRGLYDGQGRTSRGVRLAAILAFALIAVAARASAQPAAAPAPTSEDCLACHGDSTAARANGTPVAVSPDIFGKSIHGPLACVDCHADLATTTEWPHPEKLRPVSCASCHDDAVKLLRVSIHQSQGRSPTTGTQCADCHGTHDILPSSNPESRTHHLKVAETCGTCHGSGAMTRTGAPPAVARDFGDSIHGRALSRGGLMVAPTCTNCHKAHDIRRAGDPQSSVAAPHVVATCGTCHDGIRHQFTGGVHGQRLAGGDTGAPACQTCHTAHSIQRAGTPEFQLSAINQCGTCHADRAATFRDTFHGKVTSLGSRSVAGCADCHGAHEVLPASDARSPVAPARLVETCGRCHANANESFVQYDPHANPNDYERGRVLWWANRFYWLLIPGLFGFFGLHSALWFWRSKREAAARPGETHR